MDIKKCDAPFSIALKKCESVDDFIAALEAAKDEDKIYIYSGTKEGYRKKAGAWEKILGRTSKGEAMLRSRKEIVSGEEIAEKAIKSGYVRVAPYPYEVGYVRKEDGTKGAHYYKKSIEEALESKREMAKAWGAQLWDIEIIEY